MMQIYRILTGSCWKTVGGRISAHKIQRTLVNGHSSYLNVHKNLKVATDQANSATLSSKMATLPCFMKSISSKAISERTNLKKLSLKRVKIN